MNFKEYCRQIQQDEGHVRPFYAAIGEKNRWPHSFFVEEDLGEITFNLNLDFDRPKEEVIDDCLADFFAKVGDNVEIYHLSDFSPDSTIVSTVNGKRCSVLMRRQSWSDMMGKLRSEVKASTDDVHERLYVHYAPNKTKIMKEQETPKQVMIDVEVKATEQQPRWQAMDESLWLTEEEAETRNQEIKKEDALTSRLRSLCTKASNIHHLFYYDQFDTEEQVEVYYVVAYTEDDIDFLKEKTEIRLRDAGGFDKFQFGRVYIYVDVWYSGQGGGGHRTLYSPKYAKDEAAKRLKRTIENTQAIVDEMDRLMRDKDPDEKLSKHSRPD